MHNILISVYPQTFVAFRCVCHVQNKTDIGLYCQRDLLAHNWVSGRSACVWFMKSDPPADCDQAFARKDTVRLPMSGTDNHAESVVASQALRTLDKDCVNYQYCFHHNNLWRTICYWLVCQKNSFKFIIQHKILRMQTISVYRFDINFKQMFKLSASDTLITQQWTSYFDAKNTWRNMCLDELCADQSTLMRLAMRT